MPIGNSMTSGGLALHLPTIAAPSLSPPRLPQQPRTYSNANLPKDVADPGVMRAADGTYYAYATETDGPNAKNMPVYASRNLVDWQLVGDAMPTLPKWSQGDTWAPQTVRTGDHYTMFYSARDHNGLMNIGYAVSPTPAGPFEDKGIAIHAPQEAKGNNPGVTIDPAFFQDPGTGNTYLYWGSANGDKEWFAEGISAQEIAIRPDGTIENVGGQTVVKPKLPDDRNLVEAPWVEKHGNEYYMFYSDGHFVGEGGQDYRLNVARSSSPLGPFTEHRQLMAGAGPFNNPGHASIVEDDAGNDWAVYHAYKGDTKGDRQMMMDKIEWGPDGWPSINGGKGPSSSPQAAPAIRGGWGR